MAWLQVHESATVQERLFDACIGGRLDEVRYLIDVEQADPNSRDEKFGVTPLHWAACYGHIDVARYLTVEKHCDPMCSDIVNGNTPSMMLHSMDSWM